MTPAAEKITVAGFPAKRTANPYCGMLYESVEALGVGVVKDASFDVPWLRANRGKVDIIHLHWLEPFYRYRSAFVRRYASLLRFALRMCYARLLGYRIVWTFHNLLPHEARGKLGNVLATVLTLNVASRTIAHCCAAKKVADRRLIVNRKKGVTIVPHANYADCYPKSITVEESRSRLELGPADVVFLSLGLIRRYKGIERIANAFRSLNCDRASLVIAGKPFREDDEQFVRQLATGHRGEKVRVVAERVPDEEIQVYLNACDFAVFAFERILTSGSVMLAMSFGRPVIVPDMGCLSELRDTGAAIVYDPNDPNGLKNAMEEALTWDAGEAGQRAFELVKDWTWDRVARLHVDVYRQCIKRAEN
jgi:glycosyltransferase involved in cell wall biosynthesis